MGAGRVHQRAHARTSRSRAEVAKERRELERNPEAEADELAERLGRAAACRADLAHAGRRRAARSNPDEALRVHAQEELGVDPDEQPSPWTAADLVVRLLLRRRADPAAAVPARARRSLWPALVVGGAGLFAAGALVARFTGRPWWPSGLRQLLLGAAAAGATYLIGIADRRSTRGLSRGQASRSLDRRRRPGGRGGPVPRPGRPARSPSSSMSAPASAGALDRVGARCGSTCG